MATSKRYSLKYRRRVERRTNYGKRLELLKSRKPRLVVRKTNTGIIVQVVNYEPDGDKVIASADAASLKKLGWKDNTANIPSAYLVGFIVGSKAVKVNVKEAIVDLGMQEPFHGGRIFAAVKGAIDAGLRIPSGDGAFPAVERLSGAHINDKLAAEVEKIKGKVGA